MVLLMALVSSSVKSMHCTHAFNSHTLLLTHIQTFTFILPITKTCTHACNAHNHNTHIRAHTPSVFLPPRKNVNCMSLATHVEARCFQYQPFFFSTHPYKTRENAFDSTLALSTSMYISKYSVVLTNTHYILTVFTA